MEICKICGKECKSLQGLMSHINQTHKINKKDYYDSYLKIDKNEGKCKTCGRETKLLNIGDGYRIYCCNKCRNKDIEYWEKCSDTKLERYGNAKYTNRNKAKITNVEKYGVENPQQNKNVRKKTEETCMEKYGNKTVLNTNIAINGIIKKYGVDNIFKLKEFQDKRNQTMLKIFGYEYNFENDKIRISGQIAKFEKGFWKTREEQTEYKRYWLDVMQESRKYYVELFKSWDGKDYYTGEELINNENFKEINPDLKMNKNKLQPTIDHKISIIYGFRNNISIKEIGNKNNLCICSRSINSIKNYMTEKEFKNKIGKI